MLSNATSPASTSGSGWVNIWTIGNSDFRQIDIQNDGAADVYVSLCDRSNPVYVTAGDYVTKKNITLSAGNIEIQRVGSTDATAVKISAH